MKLYDVRVTVVVQLVGAYSPTEAEEAAQKRIVELVKPELLAVVTSVEARER